MKLRILSIILALTISVLSLNAQRSIIGCGGGGNPPPPRPTPTPTPTPTPPPAPTCPFNNNLSSNGKVLAPWGFYFWQLGLFSQVANLSSEMDFGSNPGGLVQIPIPAAGSLPCPITVHEIHGNVALEAQGTISGGPTCNFNSMVAQVLDQNGNTIAQSSLTRLGVSSANIPIKGKFNSPLSVTKLVLNFSLNPGCNSVLSWQLTMN